MARVWIEDRTTHESYREAVKKAKAAKKTPPGRWRVRWYDPDGKERSQTCATKPKAEKVQQDLLDKLDKGSYRDPSAGKTLFSVVGEEWTKTLRKPGRKTRHDYDEVYRLYVLPKWETWKVAAIKWEDVSAWIDALCTEPGVSGRTLSPARIIKIFGVFRMIMKFAVKSGKIAVSPAVEHELPTIEDDDEHVYLSYDQLEALARAAGDHGPLIRLLGYSGIRWGEATAVKSGRLNLDTRRLRIVQAYSSVKGKLELGPVKNHEKRTVPLLSSLVGELRPRVSRDDAEALVFTAPKGGALHYNNWRSRVFDKAVKAAGLDDLGLTPHKLRHTAASLAIAAGADVKVVQTMLGHKSAVMTLDLYGHLWPDRLDEVADRLEEGRQLILERRRVLARVGGLFTVLRERRAAEDERDRAETSAVTVLAA
ncbi:tyrosine-type recombinase/integrase [Streptomyces boncukensis]|uniref:Tyrosine-type recombinase/integrase n=1 Tax=Streptomyces boncukensis TaxID=2711219 RepID=A0A6G4WR87_9ACTN|nr:tyrosine-type recombinase/integrase [Streptomyces boncukensis]NGO67137.1 tyrosine-type recombinase/integrase [Streptomyces boncukensis]